MTHAKVSTYKIDRSDRNKLKFIARSMGDEFYETDKQLMVPAWRRRFWFKIENKVEFINEVEDVKIGLGD